MFPLLLPVRSVSNLSTAEEQASDQAYQRPVRVRFSLALANRAGSISSSCELGMILLNKLTGCLAALLAGHGPPERADAAKTCRAVCSSASVRTTVHLLIVLFHAGSRDGGRDCLDAVLVAHYHHGIVAQAVVWRLVCCGGRWVRMCGPIAAAACAAYFRASTGARTEECSGRGTASQDTAWRTARSGLCFRCARCARSCGTSKSTRTL